MCSIRMVLKVMLYKIMKTIVWRVEFILKVTPDIGHFVFWSKHKEYITFTSCFSHTKFNFNLQEMTNIVHSLRVIFLRLTMDSLFCVQTNIKTVLVTNLYLKLMKTWKIYSLSWFLKKIKWWNSEIFEPSSKLKFYFV